tara:strand:- start:2576 stop:2887 length:312 start_codon:yes stop_codon:yes gene_type:complete
MLYMRSIDVLLSSDARVISDFNPVEGGEPPADVSGQTMGQFYHSLEEELSSADVLRVTDTQWLTSLDKEWRHGLDVVLDRIRSCGKRVELTRTSTASVSGQRA